MTATRRGRRPVDFADGWAEALSDWRLAKTAAADRLNESLPARSRKSRRPSRWWKMFEPAAFFCSMKGSPIGADSTPGIVTSGAWLWLNYLPDGVLVSLTARYHTLTAILRFRGYFRARLSV